MSQESMGRLEVPGLAEVAKSPYCVVGESELREEISATSGDMRFAVAISHVFRGGVGVGAQFWTCEPPRAHLGLTSRIYFRPY